MGPSFIYALPTRNKHQNESLGIPFIVVKMYFIENSIRYFGAFVNLLKNLLVPLKYCHNFQLSLYLATTLEKEKKKLILQHYQRQLEKEQCQKQQKLSQND